MSTLHDRFPADLRAAPSGPDFKALPFTSLYLLEDEWAAEIANRTMHGVMHVGWVGDEHGGYQGQMAVLVKPNGLLGNAYMSVIKPFRHLIIYPAAIRQSSVPGGRSLAKIQHKEAFVSPTGDGIGARLVRPTLWRHLEAPASTARRSIQEAIAHPPSRGARDRRPAGTMD